ncbi:type II toxin-antitoxin system RelE/ParE family toxin [Candidatus Uhrbacteria bacterium]|nr:type II toxin-antitoxin system RelE/ParE family toxin [Candidatus Uhrbacteria bacterium]
MYQRVITPSAKRSLHRLPRDVQEALLQVSRTLETRPFTGERLHGSLSFLFSLHFSCAGIQYRCVYAVDDTAYRVIIYLVGPRENFYDRVRRLFR